MIIFSYSDVMPFNTVEGPWQTVADSLILGFSSVPILSQNYRFSCLVQSSLSEIQVQFSSLMDTVQLTILYQ